MVRLPLYVFIRSLTLALSIIRFDIFFSFSEWSNNLTSATVSTLNLRLSVNNTQSNSFSFYVSCIPLFQRCSSTTWFPAEGQAVCCVMDRSFTPFMATPLTSVLHPVVSTTSERYMYT